MHPQATISVAGLSQYIQDLLEQDEQLGQVWVTGEVSSHKTHPKGTFFTLTDPEGTASLRCVVWGTLRLRLTQPPRTGEQVTVLGSIRVYQKRGEYQLNVVQVLPAGEGLQALQLQLLRSRLEAEGLFAAENKLLLPRFPEIIAVITSPTAAAWGDIQRTLSQRYPGLRVLFSPATVQGEMAPASIVKAIEKIEKDGRAELIILARGGGAVEDLACFNDERVVRAIALCSIPVITGIGHEQDQSLADLVADFRAHTPTAAAEKVVPDYWQMLEEHRQRKVILARLLSSRWQNEEERLRQLKADLQQLPRTSRSLERATSKLEFLQEKLGALNPRQVLQRGYATVRQQDGSVVRHPKQVKKGEELIIHLAGGKIRVRVE